MIVVFLVFLGDLFCADRRLRGGQGLEMLVLLLSRLGGERWFED